MSKLIRFLLRVFGGVAAVLVAVCLAYLFWAPGQTVRDGRHDLGRNAIWLGHGWLGADEWFARNQKTATREMFRSPAALASLAQQLRDRHITDVFPHLCPAGADGGLPAVDDTQIERFLDAMDPIRVLPWVGGPDGSGVRLDNPAWRSGFCRSVIELLSRHPRLAGVHVNIEPCPSGNRDFLALLDELKRNLPADKLLSVAAYPPPTRWQPAPEVHWDEVYFRAVAKRSDQLAVMMYDTSLRYTKPYVKLMASWTREVLLWSEGKAVLLGVPTYDDANSGYHHPDVENLQNALAGIHRGLDDAGNQPGYQGVAIYCEWETDAAEWEIWHREFMRP